MFTNCDPQDEEKVTLPFCFFTVILKVAELLPFTVCEAGNLNLTVNDTIISALLTS